VIVSGVKDPVGLPFTVQSPGFEVSRWYETT
jgi:hypothetical protein